MSEQEQTVIAEFEKNSKEVVRVTLQPYNKYKLLHIRAYYRDAEGEWRPGKGIAVKQELATDLRKALQLAEKKIKEENSAGAAGGGE